VEKRHAIIVIKNDKNQYLQYFDERWNSYLFLNCKVKDKYDIKAIENEVMQKLNTNITNITYKFDRIHTKFSESDKIEKEYHHYFYKITLESYDEISKNKNFKWYSYDEFMQDERIQKVNSDIIGFIKEENI
jgi:hypothetical protein